MYPVMLAGDGVGLRDLACDDLEEVLALNRTRSEGTPCGPDRSGVILTAAMQSAWHNPRVDYALVVTDAQDRLIGGARLILAEQPQLANIGFALDPRYWGSGRGLEVLRLLLQLGFAELGLRRIWCAAPIDDPLAAQLLARGGLTEDGRILHDLFTGGSLQECLVYSIEHSHWPRSRGESLPFSSHRRIES